MLFLLFFIQVFSREYSHKDFCLAHLFTDLKFEGGILGLAYVGSPRRNSVGGICTPGDLLECSNGVINENLAKDSRRLLMASNEKRVFVQRFFFLFFQIIFSFAWCNLFCCS